MATVTEYRVAYDTRAFSETHTFEIQLADPTSFEEAHHRLRTLAAVGQPGQFNARIQSRTVTTSEWEDADLFEDTTDPRGGDASDADAASEVPAEVGPDVAGAASSGAGAASLSSIAGHRLRQLFGFDYWHEPSVGEAR